MRNRLSRAVLLTQPAFMLVVPLAVAALAFSAGLRLLPLALLVMMLSEAFVGIRARTRALARSREEIAEELDLGAEIDRADGHARLWAQVDELALEAQVAPPARITVTLATAAGVRPLPETTDRGGDDRYELVLSATLLAQATIPQLQAVVAHELGHIAAGSMTERASGSAFAQQWAQPFYAGLPPGLLKVGGWLHWQLWAPIDAWASRPGERLADDLAFRVAGPRTTAEALRRTERIEAAEALIAQRYLPLSTRARLRPSVLDGVDEVLRAPGDSIDEVLRTMRPRPLDWMHATHPSTAARIEAANRAAEESWGSDADARALAQADTRGADLLDGGRAWLVAHESDYLVRASLLRSAPASDWATVVDTGWRALLADAATDLVDTVTTPADAKGRRLPYGGEVHAPVDARPDEVTAGLMFEAVARLGAASVVHEPNLGQEGRYLLLTTVSARALDRAGRLRVPLAWHGRLTPEYFDGTDWWPFHGAAESHDTLVPDERPVSALDSVLSRVAADQAPVSDLVAELRRIGADLDSPIGLTTAERADRPGLFLGAHGKVRATRNGQKLGDTWVAVFGTSGIWLVPEPGADGWRLPSEREAQRKHLLARTEEAFCLAGGPDRAAFPDSLWQSEVTLTEVRVEGRMTVTVTVTMTDGTLMTLRLPGGAPMNGQLSIAALHGMVGNRLLVD